MIVCDKCGKPVYYRESFILKTKTLIEMKPGKNYHAQSNPYLDCETHYDLCQKCLFDAVDELRKFVNQGKFKGELK